MKQWVTKGCRADIKRIAERYRISEVFAEVLAKRGLKSWQEMDQFLFEDMGVIPSAVEMHGMKEAAEILLQKVQEQKAIRIIGDYDVDGVMSTYILYQGIALLGGTPSYQIPHRERDGYGIRTYMAEKAAADGIDTLITCDNGISAMDAVVRAKELGLTVIVTDHHEVPVVDGEEQIPPADVVVDPKQQNCQYPFRDLCGAGIAYKLVRYLLSRTGQEQKADELMPFAAIATVCDVVPLYGENRLLVKKGLQRLPECTNPGLRALVDQMQLEREITSMDFGFRIGPCINAAGRLEDASQGLELFLEKNPDQARQAAERLIALNEERKEITRQATEDAVKQIEREGLHEVVVAYSPSCHESVAGIVAGRLREKYYRPIYMVTDSGDHLKGSGRSIPGYHMQQELMACREYLLEFGGHAMAAGFSLQRDKLELLRQALSEHCSLQPEQLVEKLYFDKEVSLRQIDASLVSQLAWLEPIGEANPGAVFAKREAEIASVRMCGKQMQIAQIRLREDGKLYQAVDFHAEECFGPAICARYGADAWEQLKAGSGENYRINLLFSAEIDEMYGSLQLKIIDCQ